MHRFIRFLWITSVFRKHCSHKHLRVLHTKTFFPQKLSTLMWISALSGSNPLPSLLSPTTTDHKSKTPRAASLKSSHAHPCGFLLFYALFSGWKMDNLDLFIFSTEFQPKSMDSSDLFIFPDPIPFPAPCHQQLQTTNPKHPARLLSRAAIRGVR